MQRRAKAGGEYGANGEWYEGGKFIANTDRRKRNVSKKRGVKKIQVAPYVWVENPENRRTIFGCYSDFWCWENQKPTGLRDNDRIFDYYKKDRTEAQAALDAYLAGKQFVDEI